MKNLLRILRKSDEQVTETITDDDVIMVSTFGADKPLKDIVTRLPNKDKLSIKMVHKTAPSLKTLMCTPRRTCLGPSKGKTEKCGRRKCLCCDLISGLDCVFDQSGKSHKTAKGNCTTKNVLYHLRCKICSQPYVGKTVQMTSSRMCGHRSKYFEILKNNGQINESDVDKDEYVPGMHLYNNHNMRDFGDFNENYEMTLLEKCSPSMLDVKEHLWIQKLRTLNPLGLNSVDPFGLPLLV